MTLHSAILFIDLSKINNNVSTYLKEHGVERRDYNDLWSYLRKREWGEGKVRFPLFVIFRRLITLFQVLITPQTSYAISLMLTHFRYTVVPSKVEQMMAVKNSVELDGFRRAYLRDGASFVSTINVSMLHITELFVLDSFPCMARNQAIRRI